MIAGPETLRVALVHDWLTGMRGGERVLEALLELFPLAEIFTLIHRPGTVSPQIEARTIHTSFVDNLPFAHDRYRYFLPLFPRAVESFDLDGFDLVISSSHCVAKGARPPLGVPHLCYCHTPMRYVWDQYQAYFGRGRASPPVRVVFQSHIDGSKHLFTPESVVRTQHLLSPDVMMIFDECNEFPCTEEYARESGERTLRWAEQCMTTYDSLGRKSAIGHEQALFGIVQGSIYPKLRERFADATVAMDFPGYAVGGTCMGEDKVDTWRAIESVVGRLPAQKPRYMMGSGPPEDLVDGVTRGIDMFDCVIPTRNARNGSVFTPQGKLTIRNAKFKHDQSPLSPDCPLINRYSKAYVRHLFQANETLGLRIASVTSIDYFLTLMGEMRASIIAGKFADWRAAFLGGPYGKPRRA